MSESAAVAVHHAWNARALYVKSLTFIEQMQKHDHEQWEFAFWSSLALELIARSSLSSISPVLLADAGEWNQLYFALGHVPNQPKFVPKSVAISEVLNRLHAINSSFDKEKKDFCAKHTGMRNAELHSADTPFAAIKAETWLGKINLLAKF